MRVRLAQPARAHERHIIAAYEAASPGAGTRIARRFDAAKRTLSIFPRAGRESDNAGFRELPIAGTDYRLLYRIKNSVVEIADILHN